MAESAGELDGKVAIVTGAGRMRSIGRPIAVQLAAMGCDVVLTGTGRAPERYPEDEKAAGWRDIESVADEVRARGRRALPLVSDVRDSNAIESLLERTLGEFGRVDILVNNAGAARGADRVPIVELDETLWRNVIDTNLTGTFLMSRAFARQLLKQQQGGRIVNISSVAGKLHGPNSGAYAASKAGIQSLTATMAAELAFAQITVNAVLPGIIDTFRMDDLGRGETWERMVKQRIPLGRAGTGEDIAEMTAFLCSPRADWITGQCYIVDGGTVRQG
jgi:3-oxoacyl-[acyl-carrier protein] reductase/meso-butanediol dehydrogenase/(S,S)-butanediol dehydrogenase/diacetyl reductase